MIKRILGVLLLVPFSLSGVQLKTSIELTDNPLVAIVTLHHTFNALGYKMQIDAITAENSTTHIDAILIGMKLLNPKVLAENLQDSAMKLEYARMNNGKMELGIDPVGAIWKVPLLGSDEGVQMERSAAAYWFRVEAAQIISIEPPYGGKWYPDVSVLDSSMRVLYTYRSDKSADELKFLLPEGAAYLKVSNTNGMKVLKEGMWVESMSEGR